MGIDDIVDSNVFFRKATLKFCSSLEIEKSLWQCLWYMHEVLPVSQMSLHIYDSETGIAETIAHATLDEYKAISVKKRLDHHGRKQIELQRTTRVRIIEDTSQNPVTKPLCPYLECLGLSALIMDLVIEKNFLGVLSLQSFPNEQFNEDHRRLVSLLNEPFAIAVSNSIRYREVCHLKDVLEDDNQYLQKELRRFWGEDVIGAEFGLKATMEYVRQVAPTDSPVLLLGETGVGKELIANTTHNLSLRKDKPFIAVNCGAIPESLMDSELFGHEKGAFTGAATQKRGRFERAHGGTIFLDEIGELPLNAQTRLLRVLQEKTVERLGGNDLLNVDIRVIAATHRDLGKMMRQGLFREDLYFRLKVFPIHIPPLRQRISDIPSLIYFFIQKKSSQMKLAEIPKLAPDALDRLMAYSWPGNVRELENAVERALILSRETPLSFGEHMVNEPSQAISLQGNLPDTLRTTHLSSSTNIQPLNEVMTEHIKKALIAAKGKVDGQDGAAKLLEINPRTLRHRMRKLGIPFGREAKTLYQD